MIDQRPPHIEDREEAGYWEGDLIVGMGNLSAFGTAPSACLDICWRVLSSRYLAIVRTLEEFRRLAEALRMRRRLAAWPSETSLADEA